MTNLEIAKAIADELICLTDAQQGEAEYIAIVLEVLKQHDKEVAAAKVSITK